MEVSSGMAMTRLMSDFLVPKQSVINYNLNSFGYGGQTASFSENLPQTITYTAPPMHGRFSPLTAE